MALTYAIAGCDNLLVPLSQVKVQGHCCTAKYRCPSGMHVFTYNASRHTCMYLSDGSCTNAYLSIYKRTTYLPHDLLWLQLLVDVLLMMMLHLHFGMICCMQLTNSS
jgi:hypothetical protein